MATEMKNLTGSEKQIEWAGNIRAAFMRCLDEWISGVKALPITKASDEAKAAKIAEMESYKEFFAGQDSDYLIRVGQTLPRQYDFTESRLRIAASVKAAGLMK